MGKIKITTEQRAARLRREAQSQRRERRASFWLWPLIVLIIILPTAIWFYLAKQANFICPRHGRVFGRPVITPPPGPEQVQDSRGRGKQQTTKQEPTSRKERP